MSTNYYLINKKDKQIKLELEELIKTQLENLKRKLLEFNNKYDLDIEEEIVDVDLDWGIFEIEEIHICKTNHQTLTWQVNEYWENERQFIEFYNKNKDSYEIQDDCTEIMTLEELLEEIHWEGQKVKYVDGNFS
jgi:hypothetical protein